MFKVGLSSQIKINKSIEKFKLRCSATPRQYAEYMRHYILRQFATCGIMSHLLLGMGCPTIYTHQFFFLAITLGISPRRGYCLNLFCYCIIYPCKPPCVISPHLIQGCDISCLIYRVSVSLNHCLN